MSHRGREFNVPHALAPDRSSGYFHAALVANNPLVANALVFPAIAFPILDRAKNFLIEKTVLLRALSPIIDGFRFGNFAVRPTQNILRGGQLEPDCLEFFCRLNNAHIISCYFLASSCPYLLLPSPG